VIHLREQGELKGITIAPLIIVSIVQHCCEQSLLSLQQKLIIDIEIKAQDCQLVFHLSCNGYYENINGIPQQNSSLTQVLKRVQALYPNRHSIETHLDNGVFSLKLFLESENTTNTVDQPGKVIAYEPA
jgi:LytS/YehU family sensor histidine kinase